MASETASVADSSVASASRGRALRGSSPRSRRRRRRRRRVRFSSDSSADSLLLTPSFTGAASPDSSTSYGSSKSNCSLKKFGDSSGDSGDGAGCRLCSGVEVVAGAVVVGTDFADSIGRGADAMPSSLTNTSQLAAVEAGGSRCRGALASGLRVGGCCDGGEAGCCGSGVEEGAAPSVDASESQ